jgi:hypothetical protein
MDVVGDLATYLVIDRPMFDRCLAVSFLVGSCAFFVILKCCMLDYSV